MSQCTTSCAIFSLNFEKHTLTGCLNSSCRAHLRIIDLQPGPKENPGKQAYHNCRSCQGPRDQVRPRFHCCESVSCWPSERAFPRQSRNALVHYRQPSRRATPLAVQTLCKRKGTAEQLSSTVPSRAAVGAELAIRKGSSSSAKHGSFGRRFIQE